MLQSGVIREKQDLTYLRWSHIRSSSGTAGTFLKSESTLDQKKKYYKLSNFDAVKGVVGHECVNEIIVDRLLTILGVPHIPYQLIYADIEVDGNRYSTYLCCSEDFKEKGESKTALDDYYRLNKEAGESPYDFCVRNGWREYVDRMITVDYLILNRDRHGANIEVLRNAGKHTLRPAPLFDHGLSLLFNCSSEEEAAAFDPMKDRKCHNFIGGTSCLENMALVKHKKGIFPGKLKKSDRGILFQDLEDVLPEIFLEKIWKMIFGRYRTYEKL